MIFVDTSVLFPYLNAKDEDHEAAAAALEPVVADDLALTHDYVVVESEALIHHRLGSEAARRFLVDAVPLLTVVYVDQRLHTRARDAYLQEIGHQSSLVDHVSFEVMREHGIRQALTLDRDFARQGFEIVPSSIRRAAGPAKRSASRPTA